MENVSVAFEVLEGSKKPSAAHKQVSFHMIYDIKMDFMRKDILVVEGCRTPNPVKSTYAGVVSSKSVRIAFTYAALNGLDFWAADVKTCSSRHHAPKSTLQFVGQSLLVILLVNWL